MIVEKLEHNFDYCSGEIHNWSTKFDCIFGWRFDIDDKPFSGAPHPQPFSGAPHGKPSSQASSPLASNVKAIAKKNPAFQSLAVSLLFCVSVGDGYEVVALQDSSVVDVTGVEVIDFPPLVKRADLHNLPFFDEVFDLGFSTGFDAALFPKRFVEEIERTVRRGGVTALAVGGWGPRMGWWTFRSYFNGHPFWRSGNLQWMDLQ
ncbi:hypothetical protein KSP39_PZI012747 [Platanthera zijinensis]|uniref:Methyltransferase type 11 domain-containing protein n=1 Tax=Platanthera zijinensis TaxID=2320716 RepID=A0AAP0BF55_9ASPA